jgi:hypothetical protein
MHDVTADDVSIRVSLHDWFGVVVIKVGITEIQLFSELNEIAGIKRNLRL